MPKRYSAVKIVVPSTPCRRSPRFLHKKTPEQEPPSSLRRSTRLSHLKKSSPDPQVLKTPEPRSDNANKSSKSVDRSRNRGIRSTGSKNSLVLSNGVKGLSSLRRSPRLPEYDKNSKKSNDYSSGSTTCKNLSSGLKKSPETNNGSNLRRSPRLFEHGKNSKKSDNSSSVSNNRGNFCCGSNNRENLSSASMKCPATNTPVDGFRGLRRSQRICGDKCYKEEASDIEEAEEEFVGKTERETRMVLVGSQTKEVDGECRVVEVSRKRKRDECEESNGAVQGWTKEQELALQRAYLVAKPTPHFWKKVSKLVPGKSAQDCFSKINSDYVTPLVSRAKRRRHPSPVPSLNLSASKVLKPAETKAKSPSRNTQKSRVSYKNVRQLLQKHHQQNKDYEADLFSVLEPNLDLSTQAFQDAIIHSTPLHLQEKQGFFQKFNETTTSGHKKPLSRFSGSQGKALMSPPVLKQVKDKVLHEKYIDQLHNRDAKRKTTSKQAKISMLRMEDRKEITVPKLDVVRAAKNALVSDAISMLQHVKSNAMSKSSDSDDDDDDVFKSDGDESETEI